MNDYTVIGGNRNTARWDDSPEGLAFLAELKRHMAHWDQFAGFWHGGAVNEWRMKEPSVWERLARKLRGQRWVSQLDAPGVQNESDVG